jgi:hypothetical protein
VLPAQQRWSKRAAKKAAVEGAAEDGAAVEGAAVEGAAVDGAAVEGAAVEGTAGRAQYLVAIDTEQEHVMRLVCFRMQWEVGAQSSRDDIVTH